MELATRGLEQASEIPDVLEQLEHEAAEAGDQPTLYLLLGTKYPERLLQSKGEAAVGLETWRRKATTLKRPVKGPEWPRGVDTAQRLTQISSLLEAALHGWKMDRRGGR